MANATIKFKLPKTPLFMRSGRAAIDLMARESIKGVTAAGLEVERRAQEEAPRVFSDLARSIRSELTVIPLMAVISPNILYGTVVHEGRKPGRRPPIEPLGLWARRKFSVSEGEALRIAFLVSRKIGRSGTQPNPYMTRALHKAQPVMKAIWERALDKMTRGLN